MISGRFFLVVGPSGVGKDTLIDAAVASRRGGLVRVRRVVTRAAEAGGEVIEAVSHAEFERREAGGEFLLSWRAHGLAYGIPAMALALVGSGRDVIANGSRGVLAEARAMIPGLTILSVTARPETLAARLGLRGREGAEAIAGRLSRVARIPDGPDVIEIDNDGPLDTAVARMIASVQPVSA